MAVTVETPINTSLANGVATVFPYTFTILQSSDLIVTGELNGVTTTYTLGADYTLSGVGTGSGDVTFTTAPANLTTITRYRQTTLERTTDYPDGGDFLADTVNPDFDRIWLAIQELVAGLSTQPTSLRVPYGETVLPLPKATSRAGYYLGFDGAGDPALLLAPSGSAGALASDLANVSDSAKGDRLLGVKLLKTGAVGRTQHEKNADSVSVTDFGADPTGVMSVQAAFQAAIDAGVKSLWIPDGIYNFTGSVILPQNIQIQGSSGANLCAGAPGIIMFSAPTNCYGTILRNLRTFGLGYANVSGFDVSNLRVAAGVYDCSANNMLNGFIARTGCFGTPLVNFTCQDVDNGIQILANGSAMQIINAVIDNTVVAGGTSTGTGIYIAAGASDNIGILISSGYVQGYTVGIEDRGIGTIINGVYTELCSTADIYLNGSRKADIRSHQFFGPSGAAAIKARNTDSCEIWAPNMGSGARTVLYDVDNTNTNFVRHDLKSAAAYGTPTGALTYTGCVPIKTEGSVNSTVFGTSTAGVAGAYTAQNCKWKVVDNIGFVDVTLTWTGHTGTGNIAIALNLPSNMNPSSFTAPTLSLAVTVCGVPFTGPVVAAYFNGTGTQLTMIQSSTAGAQTLVSLPAAGTLTIKGSFPIS